MYNWLDRADYRAPCRDFPLQVDRESYCDKVEHWTPSSHVSSRPRVRSAKTLRKTASVAVTTGPTAPARLTAPPMAVGGGGGTGRSRPTTCEPKFPRVFADYCATMGLTPESPVVKAAVASHSPPRKMTDEQAAELY